MSSIKGPGEAHKYDGSALRIGIIHARWNTSIITALLSGVRSTLLAAGVRAENIETQSVPGSYELPFAAQRMYAASQVQATGSSGGSLVSAATDLLSSASSTDLKASEASAKQPFDALIAIGCLIKGETMHFEYISDAVSQGLMRVQLDAGVPVVFGLLTVLSEEQGLQRAGIGREKKGHNHGEDWGAAAVELAVKRAAWTRGEMVE